MPRRLLDRRRGTGLGCWLAGTGAPASWGAARGAAAVMWPGTGLPGASGAACVPDAME
jgi:hypothetical protein